MVNHAQRQSKTPGESDSTGFSIRSASPFRYFNSSPEIIRLAVLMYVRFPLSLRNVEDLLFERGIDTCHETVRLWWSRFAPMFAPAIPRTRACHSAISANEIAPETCLSACRASQSL